ncbi:MAG: NUDIX hydrolase [Armatimonadetes bacterium]|nr:NUDIX hydrolase [Armatimonadota bacterium]
MSEPPSGRVPVVVESHVVHRGRKIRVRLDRVRLPQGGEGTQDVIEHPGAVAVVPLSAPGRVLLIRQWRHAVGRWLLEIPAGTLEPGETPVGCARREVQEETGREPGAIEPLVTFYTTPGFTDELMYGFVARDLRSAPAQGDPDEVIETVEVDCGEALAMCLDGRITDGKTIACLLAAERAGQLG